MPFHGFPKEGIRFLKQLKKNNEREWFQPRKEHYEEVLRKPFLQLIEKLGESMREKAPELRFGPKSLFRIYRDTRFGADKSPYKTNIGASFDVVGYAKGVASPGMYLHIEPGEIFAGGGLYMPDGKQLKRIRYAMDQRPDSYLAVVSERKFKRFFGEIHGECLKKAPQGYLPDHPMIEHLRRKQFFVMKSFSEEQIGSAKFSTEVADVFTRALPFVRWLRDNSV